MGTSLTVFFDNPFWVGVFERVDEVKLFVCKVTFGAEPKDYDDLFEFLFQFEDDEFEGYPGITYENGQGTPEIPPRI